MKNVVAFSLKVIFLQESTSLRHLSTIFLYVWHCVSDLQSWFQYCSPLPPVAYIGCVSVLNFCHALYLFLVQVKNTVALVACLLHHGCEYCILYWEEESPLVSRITFLLPQLVAVGLCTVACYNYMTLFPRKG